MNSANDEPRYVTDHPERLGRLARVFERRRIAIGADVNGDLVLVRPDSVVVDAGDDEQKFAEAVARLAEADPELAEQINGADRFAGILIVVDLPDQGPVDVDGEARWSVAAVDRVVLTLRTAGLTAEANHVILASQGVFGSPVGAEANFAAGMMFTAETRDSDKGPALLSTSAPAPKPGWLRDPLPLKRAQPRVLVLDTGLRTTDGRGETAEHPELGLVFVHERWVSKDPEAVDDEDEFDDDETGFLDFEAGHGTFISGIIRQICPNAIVHIAGVLSSFGDGDVASIVARFQQALVDAEVDEFDLVVMSLGGYMSDDDGTVFGHALAELIGNGLGVAAAGNQATTRRYYPAALPDIIGVGALGEGGRAWFSNFGGWVDACAPGIDVVSTFFTNYPEDPDSDPGRRYRGWARWSGTSFSAPKVAGVIAQEMYLTGDTPKEVWKRLSNHQRYRYPDLGTVFNV